MKKNANFSAIAQTVGVSAMTVSRAFRRRGCVAAATRRRILDVAARMNYRPASRMGRPRKPAAGKRLAVRIVLGEKFGRANLYHAYLLGAIERALAQGKYDCLLRTGDGRYDNFVWLCEALRSEPPLPTMIIGHFPAEQLRALLEIAPAALLVDYTDNPRLALPYNSIGFDNLDAARQAVRHLFAIGCRRILLLKGYAEHFFSVEIERGYREMHLLNGLPVNQDLIAAADFTAGGAQKIIADLLQAGLDFDAVFTNDEMALGALAALHQRQRSVPEDVALCGCDGLPFGKYLRPPLTTMALDYAALAEMAVERLAALKNKISPPVRLRLLPKLEIRESTLLFARNGKTSERENQNGVSA